MFRGCSFRFSVMETYLEMIVAGVFIKARQKACSRLGRQRVQGSRDQRSDLP